MNINFREQPDPLLSPRGSIKSRANEEKTSYFAGRNNPHPRTMCHIKAPDVSPASLKMPATDTMTRPRPHSPRNAQQPVDSGPFSQCKNSWALTEFIEQSGLNDVPVCVVRDPGYVSGHSVMPGIEQSHSLMRTRTSIGYTFPATTMPNLLSPTSKRNSFPQPSYNLKENITVLPSRTRNTPTLKRKNDLLRKCIPEQSQNMPMPEIRGFSPTLALRYRPEIMEDMNYTLTYLDHEIKILEKLRDILQTDSLTEIKEWLSKASLKEKEFVSNFIRSNITTRDLLNYHQKYGQSESEATQLNLQAMLKGPNAMGSIGEEKDPKATGSTGEEKQLRNVSQGSRTSIGTRSDRERDNLLTGREKIIIPTCDVLPLEHSPSRSNIQEKRPTPSGIPQTSSHLLYRRAHAKQPQRISKKKCSS